MKARATKGLTLIELMVVVAVLGIVLAVAAPSFSDLMNKRRVQMVAANLSTDLAYARSEGGLRNKRVLMAFNSSTGMSCYSVYILVAGSCDCTRPEGTACIQSTELKTIQVPSLTGVTLTPNEAITSKPAKAVEFQTPNRTAVPVDAAIRIVGNRGYVLEVRLSPLGRVSTCSPDGKFGGVEAC